MRVLQVEDNMTTAKSVELMLKAQGHACETARSGQEALRLVEEKDYDLILLDIMLPDIDGYEFLKRIGSAQVRTPVLIQSGLVGNEKDRGALGMVDSLIKPYGSRELQQRIEAIAKRETAPEDKAVKTDTGEKPEPAGPKTDSDRRGGQRTRTIKSGMIVYHDSKCDMDCLVLSLSDDGAALQPQDTINLPDYFLLQIKDGSVHECQVCWRHANKLGVRFVNA